MNVTQPEKDQKRLPPPDVGPHGLAERTSRQFSSSVRHACEYDTSRDFKQIGRNSLVPDFKSALEHGHPAGAPSGHSVRYNIIPHGGVNLRWALGLKSLCSDAETLIER